MAACLKCVCCSRWGEKGVPTPRSRTEGRLPVRPSYVPVYPPFCPFVHPACHFVLQNDPFVHFADLGFWDVLSLCHGRRTNCGGALVTMIFGGAIERLG